MIPIGFLATWLLAAAALCALVPSLVLLLEVAAAVRRRPTPPPVLTRPLRMTVVVPAHDEEAQIGANVRALLGELGPGDRLLVVADHCQDRTAALAREAGAEVIERRDQSQRGKGFALSCAVAHLAADPPDVVVLVDADCAVVRGRLSALAQAALAENTVVQADFVIATPAAAAGVAAVDAFAILVRNRVRALGLDRLAQVCPLTGNGMAFPWPVLKDASSLRENPIEDLALGVELTLRGQPPRFCREVRIRSELSSKARAGLGQRPRWDYGLLDTMAACVPRLLWAFLRGPRRALLGLALDLIVPPLALLAMIQVALLVVTGAAAALELASGSPLFLAAASLALLLVATGLAWWFFGKVVLPAGAVWLIPFYVLGKTGRYFSLRVLGQPETCQRSERDPPDADAQGKPDDGSPGG
jgi:cellulose synthase/poly-beta-1,6-N-acetylglucosamine synthase-like glycosyltransferase